MRHPIIHGNQKSDGTSHLQTQLDITKLSVDTSDIESIFLIGRLPLNTGLAQPLTSSAKSLSPRNLQELNCLHQMFNFQNLVRIKIHGFEKIRSIFSGCSFRSMPQLEVLEIKYCNQLEQIIFDEEYQNTVNSSAESFPNNTSNSSTLRSGTHYYIHI